MLELIGSTELWQWDTGRQIDCAGLQAGTKVQFAYSDTQTLSTAVKSVKANKIYIYSATSDVNVISGTTVNIYKMG